MENVTDAQRWDSLGHQDLPYMATCILSTVPQARGGPGLC